MLSVPIVYEQYYFFFPEAVQRSVDPVL
jgi:hypothetical protein